MVSWVLVKSVDFKKTEIIILDAFMAIGILASYAFTIRLLIVTSLKIILANVGF